MDSFQLNDVTAKTGPNISSFQIRIFELTLSMTIDSQTFNIVLSIMTIAKGINSAYFSMSTVTIFVAGISWKHEIRRVEAILTDRLLDELPQIRFKQDVY